MKIAPPTPELPVPDVKAAQNYYRDYFGFEINWFHEDGRIGAVSHGPCALFFRESKNDLHPATFWIFAEDVDAAYAELQKRGADIIQPIANMPWGLRQFSVRDLNGYIFHFHHDIGT